MAQFIYVHSANHDHRDWLDWRVVGACASKEEVRGTHRRMRSRRDLGTGPTARRHRYRDRESRRRSAWQPGCSAGDTGAGDYGFDRAPWARAAGEDLAYRRGQYEGGRSRARAEGVWQECGEAVSGGASHGGERDEWSRLRGCGFISQSGVVSFASTRTEFE